MKIGVIGGGAWGTALAQVAAQGGGVTLWAREPDADTRRAALAERGLAELGFERLDLLRPGLLLGERGERRLAEGLGQRLAPLAAIAGLVIAFFALGWPGLAGSFDRSTLSPTVKSRISSWPMPPLAIEATEAKTKVSCPPLP